MNKMLPKKVWCSLGVWRTLTGLSVALFVAAMAYEIRLVERTFEKLETVRPNDYMDGRLTMESMNEIALQTLSNLVEMNPILQSPASGSRIERLIRRTIGPPDTEFHFSHALLVIGLLEHAAVKDSAVKMKDIESWCQNVIDSDGKLLIPIKFVDDCMLGYAFCDLYERTHEIRYKRAADQMATYLMKVYPRSPTGTLPYSRQQAELAWIDDKGEVCGFLVRYGITFDVPEATELGARQLLEYVRFGFDPATGLPWQACRPIDSTTMGLLGWLRGIGWLSMGFATTLEYLPEEHEHYDELQAAFVELLTAVRSYQRKDACWNWEIRNRSAREDTSGTAMIGYAVEKAISSGSIDSSWAMMSESALAAVQMKTFRNGVVTQALADCKGIGLFSNYFGPSNYAQGPATALYSLIYQRTENSIATETQNTKKLISPALGSGI